MIGFGQFRPIRENVSAEGRNANRRVVMVILGGGTLPAVSPDGTATTASAF